MSITRRSFFKQVSLTAAATPFMLSARSHAAAQAGPNGLINMAFIGLGIQNRILLNNFLTRNVKVRAICDVDTHRRDHALGMVTGYHAAHPESGAADCKGYHDFREVMARKDIDAVCIATPDHWHALITLAALESGKDVYCEKPLTHNIHEAHAVMESARKNKRILQTGSMQRSMSEFRIACELVRNGVIGELERVECKVGDPGRPCDLPEEEMEPGLDWNAWLGPAQVRPYHSALSPRGVPDVYPNWRSFQEFGGGGVCDFGAHHFDIAQWGLGMDESGPVEARPPEKAGEKRGATLVYANGVTLEQVADGPDIRFFGSEAVVSANRGSFSFIRGLESMGSQYAAEKKLLADAKVRLYQSNSHTDDFLARVADRKRPISSEVEGGHSAICCHLMNLSYYHHATIKWNPTTYAFVDGTGDPAWLTCAYRAPWKM